MYFREVLGEGWENEKYKKRLYHAFADIAFLKGWEKRN